MATSALATAFVNIVPGTAALEQYLRSQLGEEAAIAGTKAGTGLARGMGQSFGSKIKGLIGPALASVSAGMLAYKGIDFLKESIQSASDFNEQGSAVGQVFGKAAADIQKFAASGATSLGQSKVEILDAAKTFGIYGQSAGMAGAKNAAFSKQMVGLATDLASFNNTSVSDAIEALGAGLRGEAEPLRRYGVLLSDATLKTAYFNETGKKVNGVLTPQQRVLAAHAAILQQTATQQGDFGRTSAGLANQQRILAAQFTNTQIAVGTMFLPVMTNLVTTFNTSVMPAISTFIENFKQGKTPLNTFFDVIRGAIGYIHDNWTWIGTLATAVLAGVAAFKAWTGAISLWNNITKIASAVQLAFNAIMAANPIMLVVIAVAALVAGLVYFFTQTKVGQKIWAGFVGFLSDSWKNIVKSWNGLVAWFGALPGVIGGFFSSAGTWLLQAGKNIVQGLLNGISSLAGTIGSFFLNLLPSWIVAPFKAALGIHSPSKVFHEFGKNIAQGLMNGLSGSKSDVSGTMQKVSNWLTTAFDSKKINASQKAAGLALVKAFSTPLKAYEAQYKKVLDELDTATQNLNDKIKERADYVSNLAKSFGATLQIDTTVSNADSIASAKNDLAKAQEDYNAKLKDEKATLTEIEDARLAINRAQEAYNKAKNPGTTYKDAVKQLQDRIAKSKELKSVTDQLLTMGIDKNLYQQIVEAGAVDFAKSIIEGGQEAVTQLNVLSKEADSQALKLANQVGDVLYNQGIQFAQSVVDGLKQNKAELEALMEGVAAAFKTALTLIVQNNKAEINVAVKNATGLVDAAIKAAQAAADSALAAAKQASSAAVGLDALERKAAALKATASIPVVPTVAVPAAPETTSAGSAGTGATIVYNAAPNNSLSSEADVREAIRKAKAVGLF